jgi:hypothetical protein
MIISFDSIEHQELICFAKDCITLCEQHFTYQYKEAHEKVSLIMYEDTIFNITIAKEIVNISVQGVNNDYTNVLMVMHNNLYTLIPIENFDHLLDYPKRTLEKIKLNEKLKHNIDFSKQNCSNILKKL